MKVWIGWLLVTAATGAALAAVGLTTDLRQTLRELKGELRLAGIEPRRTAWVDASARLAARIQSVVPVRLRGEEYATLVGLRLFAWTPVVPALALAFAWAVARGMGRRSRCEEVEGAGSPVGAYLAKRGVCLSIFLAVTSVLAPFWVPVWFLYVAAVGAALGGWAYARNLPERW
jgi:hypothetical protein